MKLKEKINPLKICPIKELIIIRYAPRKSWFDNVRIRTIHGISHALRVMLYSYILCKTYKIDRIEPFLVAASIHDIKRVNDREDKNHGERVSKWFYHSNIDIKSDLSNEEIKEICLAVKNREHKYSKFRNSKLKIDVILKCADALDRYRLPKRKWWIKKELVPLRIPNKIINFSKYFTIKTEEEIINGKDPLRAILELARKYNLVLKRALVQPLISKTK